MNAEKCITSLSAFDFSANTSVLADSCHAARGSRTLPVPFLGPQALSLLTYSSNRQKTRYADLSTKPAKLKLETLPLSRFSSLTALLSKFFRIFLEFDRNEVCLAIGLTFSVVSPRFNVPANGFEWNSQSRSTNLACNGEQL